MEETMSQGVINVDRVRNCPQVRYQDSIREEARLEYERKQKIEKLLNKVPNLTKEQVEKLLG